MTTDSAFSILNWMTLVLCAGLLLLAIVVVYFYLFDKAMQLLRLKVLFFKFLVARQKLKQLAKQGRAEATELSKDQSSEDGCNE